MCEKLGNRKKSVLIAKIDDILLKVIFLDQQKIVRLGCCFSKSVLYNII